MKIKIANFINDSVVDGSGIRFTLFTQGCPHRCKGCHNEQTHDFDGGYFIEIDEILEKIKKNPLLDGVTLSGGEPFLQPNEIYCLLKKIRELDNKLDIIIYTGYLWEDILNDSEKVKVLDYVDILIDGKFDENKKSLDLVFKGSTNQRTIDVKKSLEKNSIILFDFNR